MRIAALVLVVLTAAAGFSAPANAAAKIYKWTDANGQVHFDSSPPPGQATEKVRIQKGVDAPPPAPDAAAPVDDKAQNSAKPVLTPAQRAELSTYCGAIRERITVLKQGGNVVERNPDGTNQALGADAIASKVAADESSLKTYCTANGL